MTNNCYDDLDAEKVNKNSVTGYLCEKQDHGLDEFTSVFTYQSCQKSPKYDEREQVIMHGSDNYIYCPNRTIHIQNKDYQCPEHVFMLPVTENFGLENYRYKTVRRSEVVVNALEKQMNDDINVRLKLDKYKIYGINTTNLEREYGRLGKIVDDMLKKNMTMVNMTLADALTSPFVSMSKSLGSLWNWFEKGMIVASVVALVLVLTLVSPVIEILFLIIKMSVRFFSNLSHRLRSSARQIREKRPQSAYFYRRE